MGNPVGRGSRGVRAVVSQELSERVVPTFDALLAYYARLDVILADGRVDELPASLTPVRRTR
ncbi:hypothetical protein NKG94_30475 [Micromonospora sp. M12]